VALSSLNCILFQAQEHEETEAIVFCKLAHYVQEQVWELLQQLPVGISYRDFVRSQLVCEFPLFLYCVVPEAKKIEQPSCYEFVAFSIEK